jgi:hypothetical protein
MAHFRDFKALLDEVNAAVRAKGLVPFQLWEAAFGRFNDFLMVAEYETLEAYEREQHVLHADAAYMNLWREMGTHMTGVPGGGPQSPTEDDRRPSGAGLVNGMPDALYWLVAVIIGPLMSATRSSWDLLVKVGEERRATQVVG